MRNIISLKNYREFGKVYDQKESFANKYLVMYLAANSPGYSRIGISVSKKVGNSVVRHTFARRMREIFRKNDPQTVQGKDIIIVARNQAGSVSYEQLNKDYVKLLQHHRIYKA